MVAEGVDEVQLAPASRTRRGRPPTSPRRRDLDHAARAAGEALEQRALLGRVHRARGMSPSDGEGAQARVVAHTGRHGASQRLRRTAIAAG